MFALNFTPEYDAGFLSLKLELLVSRKIIRNKFIQIQEKVLLFYVLSHIYLHTGCFSQWVKDILYVDGWHFDFTWPIVVKIDHVTAE